jgi:hypothetical protein
MRCLEFETRASDVSIHGACGNAENHVNDLACAVWLMAR